MTLLPGNPIFIVGYPRSGTTWLQRLLAAQPGIRSLPETHFFNVADKKLNAGPGDRVDPGALERGLQAVFEKMAFRFDDSTLQDLGHLAETGGLTVKGLFERLAAAFVHPRGDPQPSEPPFRWLEKTPNHAHCLHRITDLYPDAKILHMVRHPVPAVMSRKLKFPFNRETPLEELAQRWTRLIRDVEAFDRQRPGYVHSLRYEDLTADMETVMTTAMAFLGLQWRRENAPDHNPAAASALILPSETWKIADLQNPQTNTNPRYAERLTPDMIRQIESATAETMKRWGYDTFAGDCHARL